MLSDPHKEEERIMDFWIEVGRAFRRDKRKYVDIIMKAAKGKLDKAEAEKVFDEIVKTM